MSYNMSSGSGYKLSNMYQKIHHYPKEVLKNSQKSKFKFKITDFKHFFRVVVHLLVHVCKFVAASITHVKAHIEAFSLFFQYIGFKKKGAERGAALSLDLNLAGFTRVFSILHDSRVISTLVGAPLSAPVF